jgi:hypothetical protein
LFTEKALVVFWKFLNWCNEKGSFVLPAFMFILVTIFGIKIRNIKKVMPLLKQQLRKFFSDLKLEKDLCWETIKDTERSAVIRRDVKLVEGLNLPKITSPLEI